MGADRHARRYVTRGLGSNPGSPRHAPSDGCGFGCDNRGDSGTAPRLGPMRCPVTNQRTPKTGSWCVTFSFADSGRSEPFMLRYSICKGQSREVFGIYLGLHLADSISYVKLPAQRRRAATSGGAELSGAEGAAEGEKRTKNPRSNPVAGPRGVTRSMTDGAESANSTSLSELLENHFDQKRNHRRGALPWAFFPDRLSHDFDAVSYTHLTLPTIYSV